MRTNEGASHFCGAPFVFQTPIRLKAGENRIRLVMPKASGPWGGLFVPAVGTSVHPREID